MPEMQILEFNKLPEAMRQRFVASLKTSDVEARPVIRMPQQNGRFLVAMFSIALVLGLFVLGHWFSGFGRLDGEDGFWQGNEESVFYMLAIAALVFCLLAAYRRIVLHRGLPFTPGKYLYAFSLVDAGTSNLKHYDLAQAIDSKAVHQRDRQGRYAGTKFLFYFDGAKMQSVLETDQNRAQAVGQELNRRRELVKQAVAAKDAQTLLTCDPFNEIRTGKFIAGKIVKGKFMARPLGEFHRWRVLIALIVGVLLGSALWFVRNVESDETAYAAAKTNPTETKYLQYIKQGHRHVQEMKAGLPRVAFDDARKTHSVTKLRAVLKRYPEGELDDDVKAEVHKLYLASAEKFRAQAAHADPGLVPFVEQMLATLEASGNPVVQLRFTRPSSDELERMDGLLAKFARTQGKSAEAAAPWFTNKSDAEREQKIVVGLQQGFSAIFPSDVMQISTTAQIDPRQPTMDIAYQIAGSGHAYTMTRGDKNHPESGTEQDNRMFVGLICKFAVNVALPDQPPGWHFDLSVLPPEHFEVKDDAPEVLNKFGVAPTEHVSGSSVYRIMAERAFDAMREKMRDVLFRPGSDAYTHSILQKVK